MVTVSELGLSGFEDAISLFLLLQIQILILLALSSFLGFLIGRLVTASIIADIKVNLFQEIVVARAMLDTILELIFSKCLVRTSLEIIWSIAKRKLS